MTSEALQLCLSRAGPSLRVLDFTAVRALLALNCYGIMAALRAVPAAAAALEELLTPIETADSLHKQFNPGHACVFYCANVVELCAICPNLCRGDLHIIHCPYRFGGRAAGMQFPKGVRRFLETTSCDDCRADEILSSASCNQPELLIGLRLVVGSLASQREDGSAIAQHLAPCSALQALRIGTRHHGVITKDFIDGLAPLMTSAPLQGARFHQLNRGACTVVMRLLSRSCTLRSLILHSITSIAAEAGTALGVLLRSSTCQLARLELGAEQSWLGTPAITPIAAALQHNSTLTHLSIHEVALDNAGSAALASAIAHSTSLRVFKLDSFCLNEKLLFEGIRGSSLTSLKMVHCRDVVNFQVDHADPSTQLNDALGDERCMLRKLTLDKCSMDLLSVAHGLSQNKSLTALRLCATAASDAEMQAICAALVTRDASLHTLDLSEDYLNRNREVELTEECARELVRSLCSGKLSGLRRLSVSGIPFGDGLTAKLAAAVSQHTTQLETLNMDHCGFGVSGIAALAHLLTSHASLSCLSMNHNDIADAGALALAAAWPMNRSRAELSLRFCNIGRIGVEAILAARESSPIWHLDLDDNADEEEEDEEEDDEADGSDDASEPVEGE